MLIIILVLLVVQAWCDLSLPGYTSKIIDVGIQDSGVEHVVPEAITSESYEMAELFMSDKETAIWRESYDKDGDIYRLNVTDKAALDKLDTELSTALIMDYQMSAVNETSFKRMMAAQMGKEKNAFDDMTVQQIGQMIGMDLKTFTRIEDDANGNPVEVLCVDVREIFKHMLDTGIMSKDNVLAMRGTLEKTIDAMGSSLASSMGVAFAVQASSEAGIDVDAIQIAYLWKAGLKMIGLALIMGLTTVVVGFFAAKVGAGVGMNLRKNIFTKVIGFSNAEMDNFSTASLITRSTNDIQQIQLVSTMMLRMIAYAPILGIGGIIKVTQTGAGMGWVIGLAVLVMLGFVGVLVSVAMPKFKMMQKMVDGVNLVAREILTGLSVIRAFGREKTEEERFDVANRALTKTMLFTNRVMTFMMPGMMLIMYGLTILIVWVGAHRIDAGVMQVGTMTAFITYAMMIIMSFLMLTFMSIMLPRAAVSAERIDEVVRTENTIVEIKNPLKINEPKGVITFEHVDFCYPKAEENALDDIDFTAEPGKTTAIIGSTGSGKTTLISLIPRLYDVTAGSIKMDGVDIRDLSLKDLRDEIGYVPQKGILFYGTIASNLRFGNRNATDEEIREAAQIAQAVDFIEEKNDKYESSIAQGGSNVSGGQKQRLSIARAIAKKPRIFIFDDSFSALDLKTDSALRKALKEQLQGSTVIIVAQRISTILHADQILVLDDGRIVDKGTHGELLLRCEVYQEIATSQLSEKELDMMEERKEEAIHE
nr:ABC transporter ATP-binding protein [Parasporobacterium paucivorans]